MNEVHIAIRAKESKDAKELRQFAYSDNIKVVIAVAGNVNTDKITFRELSTHSNVKVIKALINNPSLPQDILFSIFERIIPIRGINSKYDRPYNNDLMETIIRNAGSTSNVHTIEYLSHFQNSHILCAIARNKNSGYLLLESLSKLRNPSVRCSLLQNENLPYALYEDILRNELTTYKNNDVLRLLIRHTFITSDDIFDIYKSIHDIKKSANVIRAIVENKKTPINIIDELIGMNNETLLIEIYKNSDKEGSVRKKIFKQTGELRRLLLQREYGI